VIEVTAALKPFLTALGRADRAVGFARTVALTRTARATVEFLKAEMVRVFKAPTPWALGGLYWQPATSDRDEYIVGVKDDRAVSKGTPASKFLAPEIYGGQRGQKRSERALTRYAPPDVKRAMGNRGYWVPGPGIALNAYGNVSGSTMVQILSDLKAFGEVGFTANRTAKSAAKKKRRKAARYFIMEPNERTGKTVPVVWVRKGGQIMPALIFVSHTNYTPRFDFFGRGQGFAAERYPIELEIALKQGFGKPK
jgi:hypothetical protein